MNRPEEQVQRAIVEYLSWGHFDFLWFAVPNQRGTRKKFEAQILNALGVRAGVSDLVFVLAGGRALFVEVKAPGKESNLSPKQKEFRDDCDWLGAPYYVVSSVDDVTEILKEYDLL